MKNKIQEKFGKITRALQQKQPAKQRLANFRFYRCEKV